MKKLFSVLVLIFFFNSMLFSQIDTVQSVVLTKKEALKFENDLTYAGSYLQGSGITQILGIAFAGGGLGLTLANLKNPKKGFQIGSYVCFGLGGVFTITSAGLKIAGGSEIRNLRLKQKYE